MGLLNFLKPNGAKIIYFLFLLVVGPFPYFIFSEGLGQYEVKWIWGFPPLISLIYDFLPSSLQELNIGILEISTVKTTYYWIPTYAFFIFLLSCVIGLIMDKLRKALPSIPNSGSRGADGGTYTHIAFQKITRPAQFTSDFKSNTPRPMTFCEWGMRNLSNKKIHLKKRGTNAPEG